MCDSSNGQLVHHRLDDATPARARCKPFVTCQAGRTTLEVMPDHRHERAIARAQAARRRARDARGRAVACRGRGEEWFAEVEERLAAAEEPIQVNAEMLIARLRDTEKTNRSTSEWLEAARAAQQKALGYARIHYERREISRACGTRPRPQASRLGPRCSKRTCDTNSSTTIRRRTAPFPATPPAALVSRLPWRAIASPPRSVGQ
jgi:hypothetical protein